MGTVGGFTVEDAGGSFDIPPVLKATTDFPANLIAYRDPPLGAESVPPIGPEGESPDPRALVPGQPQMIGWIATAVFDGPWAMGTEFDVLISQASMAPDGGAAIPISTETAYQPFAVAVVPHRPLEPTTWYTARAVGVLREADLPPEEFNFDVTWHFRTNEEVVPTFDDDVTICDGREVTMAGSSDRDLLRGTRARDVIAGYGGNDVIRGLAGADLVCGGGGADRVYGGRGKDLLRGEAGRDRLFGGGGPDRLVGETGRDALFGGRGSRSS